MGRWLLVFGLLSTVVQVAWAADGPPTDRETLDGSSATLVASAEQADLGAGQRLLDELKTVRHPAEPSRPSARPGCLPG